MTETIQHEKGKADVIADGPGSVRQVPEGEAEKAVGEQNKDGGFINGKPATKEEVERSTRPR
jgi:hypothetical protein